jgi:Zn-dependent protease with chaperone function
VSIAISALLVFSSLMVVRALPWIAVALAVWETWQLLGEDDPLHVRRKPGRLRAMLLLVPGLMVGPAILIVGCVFPFALLVLRLAVSRNREFQADATAVALTRNPLALLRALEALRDDRARPRTMRRGLTPLAIAPVDPAKRARTGTTIVRPLANLFATHPPLDERIARIRAMVPEGVAEVAGSPYPDGR